MSQTLDPLRHTPGRGPATPWHPVLGDPHHGVSLYAAQLARACGAPVVRDLANPAPVGVPVHLHVTDRLLGATPDAAAAEVERLARTSPLTLTLHDVPQPTDGPSFRSRAAAYERMLRVARGWVTSSEHERSLVTRWCRPSTPGAVIPLPVVHPPAHPAVRPDAAPVLGIFGFVYPGKGHREVVRAAGRLRRTGTPARVLVVGGPAPGHAGEVADLVRVGDAFGVPVEVTGHVPDEQVAQALWSVAVPVVAHRNVSASGSLNSWLAAGRRPLVRTGSYAREMAALRPGSMALFDDDELAARAARVLREPHTAWIDPAVDLRPHLDDVARAYAAWWGAAW